MFVVREDDLTGEQTRDLLALHLTGMCASSPPGSVFALDLSGLRVPEVTVWSAWTNERIAAVGALKMLADGNGEVKSMRTIRTSSEREPRPPSSSASSLRLGFAARADLAWRREADRSSTQRSPYTGSATSITGRRSLPISRRGSTSSCILI